MTFPRLSLRTAVILPFTIVLVITMLIITVVQKMTYEKMLQEMSQKQLTSISQNIESNLLSFLHAPFKVSIALSEAISYNNLYEEKDVSRLTDFFRLTYSSLESHIPQLDSLAFGGQAFGQYVGLRREKNHDFSLLIKDHKTNNSLLVYHGKTRDSDVLFSVNDYEPRVRPWYAPVAETLEPMWSDPYTNNDDRQEVTLSALTPVMKGTELVGVLSADVKLNSFDEFLAEQKKRDNSSIFIFDQNKQLIAHSDIENSIISKKEPKSNNKNPLSITGKRITITESADPIIRATANQIINKENEHSNQSIMVFYVGGKRYFSYVGPFVDDNKLNWTIAVTLPESELLGDLPAKQQKALLFGFLICLIASAIGFVVFNTITKPINETAKAARQLAKGNWNTSIPNYGYIEETTTLVKSFTEMANNLKASFEALRIQLTYDSLTHTYSRQGLIEASKNTKSKKAGTLFIIGLERFRDINDSLGHMRGDQVLIIISERLKSLIPSHYNLARIGGDEFAIHAVDLHDTKDINSFVYLLKQQFISPIKMGAEHVLITPIIGHSSTPIDSNIEYWLRNASIAQSFAKKEPLRISAYQPKMAEDSLKRTQNIAKITQAIKNKEFIAYYQPIIDLSTNKTIGAEALARWVSPKEGIISPLEFIPIAEKYGLIYQIGYQILLQACCDTKRCIDQGVWPESFHIHVNVSVHQLGIPTFINELEDILEISQLSVHNLTLEITESNIVDNDPIVLDNITAVRKMGVKIAIDDFGTGYSSLSYLHQMPFDCLKIDLSFVQILTKENAQSSIAAAILGMTKGLDIVIVSEGVETQEQADILKNLGCQQAQGYLYSKPLPLEDWTHQFHINHDSSRNKLE
ncbi:bifunctional diguanylate cyclase/phosphodiesterase [Vibrio rumoiensis]|uniref:Diguanylate cyclase n=1 Tax=Vibrio rumoiensis 1S-45 TaxID=1188252 RepID=A0A1E5E625_9VIBR|nr:EAL domain-containing protein [Vibrio rumoiensis]OEF29428.1 hypothetical protein A1QC_04055 [Vibrio rumoiensis 1S-45]